MLNWLRERLNRPSPLEMWSVSFRNAELVTDDGEGNARSLPIDQLRRVVVATDDSGPWGADVVYLLYTDETDPVGVFPMEAKGTDAFILWMSEQPGYDDHQLRAAMRCTSVARFTVFISDMNVR